jgi:hypothetical protein
MLQHGNMNEYFNGKIGVGRRCWHVPAEDIYM